MIDDAGKTKVPSQEELDATNVFVTVTFPYFTTGSWDRVFSVIHDIGAALSEVPDADFARNVSVEGPFPAGVVVAENGGVMPFLLKVTLPDEEQAKLLIEMTNDVDRRLAQDQ